MLTVTNTFWAKGTEYRAPAHTAIDGILAKSTWQRGFLLALILLAFARTTWQLDGKVMWWDESLSLQRAEADWGSLLRGDLIMMDGINYVATTDQHPFLFFVLEGVLLRLAGISEYVLRFPAAAAATLMVTVIWVLAANYARRQVLPPATPYWAALFIAINPFLLWYGQEARPYAVWAMLALLHAYVLLRILQAETLTVHLWVGYGFVTLLHLSSHYYAIFVLPIHALALFLGLVQQHRWWAVTLGGGLLMLGAGVALWVAKIVLGQGGGGNFSPISFRILMADLLNAFSMGLSVNINDVRWLNWLFGILLLTGVVFAIRSSAALRDGGWLLPAFIATPIGAVLVMSQIQPGYMNARHLSLLVGFAVLTAAGGLGVIWRYQRFLSGALAALLVAGTVYSTFNYFTAPQYSKDDYRAMGSYLERHLLPGDLLLIHPTFSWRIFTYYLPIEQIHQATAQGIHIGTQNMPLLYDDWPSTFAMLANARRDYRRIWLARSGTHPVEDPENRVKNWLRDNSAMHLKEIKFHSSDSFLILDLFLPEVPVVNAVPAGIMHPLDVTYGAKVRLIGYDLDRPIGPQNAIPITLYWQIAEKTEERYKYILRLFALESGGEEREVGVTEREPYDGVIPTNLWGSGQTIIEYSEVPMNYEPFDTMKTYQFTLQLYHADTLEKLSVTEQPAGRLAVDEQTVVLPLPKQILD